MATANRQPLHGGMTLEQVAQKAAEAYVERGQDTATFQIAGATADGRKLVITVAVRVDEHDAWPELLPGTGGLTRQ